MIMEYPFQAIGEENNYQQLPDEIENNEHVFFTVRQKQILKTLKSKVFNQKLMAN